jgi:hypothetical protein
MKRFVLCFLVLGMSVSLFAQTQLPEHRFAAGNWSFIGSRLYQNDGRAGLAKMNVRVPQSGPMLYEFNARYEGGAEDGHGGLGLHVFVDSAFNGPSWGAGTSYLLWLNYDEKPISPQIPRGLSAQVYRSRSNSAMDLVESVDLNQYSYTLTNDNLAQPVPFKIEVNGDTGEVRVYNPIDPNLADYYYFYVNTRDIPLKGNWVALRTNGMKLSFAMGL